MSAGLSLNYTLIQSQRQQKTSGMCECRSLTNYNLWHSFDAIDNLLEPVKAHGSGRLDIQYKGGFCVLSGKTNMPMFLLTIIDKHQHSSQAPKITVSDDESILSRSLIQSYI